MPGMLRFFGVAAMLSGAAIAGIAVVGMITTGVFTFLGLLEVAAWLVGGVFWLALCLTVVEIHENVQAVARDSAEIRRRLRASS